MKQKSLIALLRGCMLLLLLPLCLSAKATAVSYDVWDGSVATAVPYSGHTYTVTTVAQLAYLSQQIALHSGYTGDTIRIAANLDINGLTWTPIGTAACPFSGELDGQNHLIRGFSRFNGTVGIGLFGYIHAVGKVYNLGISGGQLEANNQRKVGTIAGVNGGLISHCWNMAEIHVAGTCVGGLVGENSGTLRDVYNAGLILRAADTIGGLVGMNRGAIEYAYSIGYVHNGNALVGYDRLGCSYIQCYHDRKLYYQSAGSLESGVYSVDRTGPMGSLFLTRSGWVHATNLYPALSGFETTDASLLSVSPLWLDTTVTTPPDHANDLSMNFTVSTLNGVVWSCREEHGASWIQISGSNATVRQTCDGADVLLNADLGSERRIVYTHPRRLNDFKSGSFKMKPGVKDTWCIPSHIPVDSVTDFFPASDGWKYGNYHYKVDLDTINPATGDTTFLRNLVPDTDESGLRNWYNNDSIEALVAGYYFIRVYAHDEQCSPDWMPAAGGGYAYEVLHEFDPGTIAIAGDTVYAPSTKVNITSLTDAIGGGGTITYTWYVTHNGSRTVIPGQTGKDLVDYTVTDTGSYVFSRGAADEFCETMPSATLNHGYYELVLRDTIDPGQITNTPTTVLYCNLADALKDTIYASKPTGGTGIYDFQWYMDGTELTGLTKSYLALADVTGLTAGSTHVFTRRVKDDSGLTTFKQTRLSYTVTISAGFDPGRILNKDLGDKCIMVGITKKIEVDIYSIVDASGSSTLTYTWYRAEADGSNPVVVGHDAELDIEFSPSDIELNKTYIYYREVTDETCSTSSSRSIGQVTQTYVANEHKSDSIIICSSLIKNGRTYPVSFDSGGIGQLTINDVGKTTTLIDYSVGSEDCHPTLTITLDTVSPPAIRVDSFAKLCQKEGTITIDFEMITGEADSFYIELSPSLSHYFNDQTVITGTMPKKYAGEHGSIVLNDVKRIGMGTNYLHLQVGNKEDLVGEEVCFSMMHRIDLEVSIDGYVHFKFDKVLFVDNAPDDEDHMTFTAYQWYKDGVLQPGQTGQYYQENGQILRGRYYVELTTIEKGETRKYNSCPIEMPKETSANAPAHEEQQAYITIYNDQVVIVRDNQMFDMLGRAVK